MERLSELEIAVRPRLYSELHSGPGKTLLCDLANEVAPAPSKTCEPRMTRDPGPYQAPIENAHHLVQAIKFRFSFRVDLTCIYIKRTRETPRQILGLQI